MVGWINVDATTVNSASATSTSTSLIADDLAEYLGVPVRMALDAETIHELRDHRKRQLAERLASEKERQDHGLVFAQENGLPIVPSALSRRFARLAAQAGLPDLRPRPFHGLRHTYATLALEAGVPIEIVSKRLGHASIAITADLYQHVTKSVDRDAAEAVAGLILGRS